MGSASTSGQGPGTEGRIPSGKGVMMGFIERLELAPHHLQPVCPGAHLSQRLSQSWFLTKTPNHYAIFIQTMTFGQFFF